MSELLREQMSAFCDDALPTEESALLLRRLDSDGELMQSFACYQLIGASIRREPDASALAARVRSALQDERVAPAGRRAVGWQALLRPGVGGYLAATVAVLAITGVRLSEQQTATLVSATTSEPPIYVVPQSTDTSAQFAGRAKLASYVMRHGNYATMPNPPVMNFRGVGQHARATATLEPAEEQPESPPPEPEPQPR
jgi:negative regulator of sigma E activity